MQKFITKLVCLACAALYLLAARAKSQTALEETLSGPDSHETGQGPQGHLFGVHKVGNVLVNTFAEPQFSVYHHGSGLSTFQLFFGVNFQFRKDRE